MKQEELEIAQIDIPPYQVQGCHYEKQYYFLQDRDWMILRGKWM